MYLTINGFRIALSDFLFILSILLVSSTLLVSGKLNSISIIFAVITALFFHLRTGFRMLSKDFFSISVVILFFVHLLSLFFSDNFKSGLFEIEKKLSLFFIPLIFMFENNFSIKWVRFVLYSFVFSCLFYLTYYLVKLYFHDPLETVFFVEKNGFNLRRALDMYYGIHPTYISMYLLLSASIFFMLASNSKNRFISILFTLFSLLLCGVIFSLGSRIVIISTIVTIFILFVLQIKRQNIFKNVLLLSLLFVIFLGVYKLTPSIQHRFVEVFTTPQHGPYTKEEMNSTNIRFAILQCSKTLKNEANYFWGFGVGDAQDELNQCYGKFGWTKDITNYNFHNQYLQTYFELGLVGFVSLLTVFFIPIVISLREKKYLLLLFSTQFCIISFTESILANQQGIVFFVFMTCLLLKLKDDDLKITLG